MVGIFWRVRYRNWVRETKEEGSSVLCGPTHFSGMGGKERNRQLQKNKKKKKKNKRTHKKKSLWNPATVFVVLLILPMTFFAFGKGKLG